MELLELPTEILGEILQHTVLATEARKQQVSFSFSVYFSPTGFAETFDTEVLHAIFVTRILHDYRKLDHYGREILSQYLASRALTDTRGNNGLTATIRYVADSLQGADGNDRQQKLEENSKALCRLATKYLSEKRVLEILETETQQTVDKVRDKSTYQEQKNDPSTHNSPTNSLDDSATDVLVGAAFLGDVDKVRGILRAMNKPRRKSRFFGSPVSAAAGGGHGDIFMLLLDHGVSPDLEGPTRTWDPPVLDPLLATCWGGHLSIVRQCLDSKCSSTLRLSEAAATLEAACGGHLEILQLLAARQTTSLSSKVFKMAAQMGHEEIVRVFLDRNLRSFGFEVAKEIAFEAAARYGQTHIVRMFLAPEYTHKYDLLYNSLEARALTGFKNSVEVLLAAGASVNDVEPAFLVLVAAADGHAHIVEFLLENGADFQRGMLLQLGVNLEEAEADWLEDEGERELEKRRRRDLWGGQAGEGQEEGQEENQGKCQDEGLEERGERQGQHREEGREEDLKDRVEGLEGGPEGGGEEGEGQPRNGRSEGH